MKKYMKTTLVLMAFALFCLPFQSLARVYSRKTKTRPHWSSYRTFAVFPMKADFQMDNGNEFSFKKVKKKNKFHRKQYLAEKVSKEFYQKVRKRVRRSFFSYHRSSNRFLNADTEAFSDQKNFSEYIKIAHSMKVDAVFVGRVYRLSQGDKSGYVGKRAQLGFQVYLLDVARGKAVWQARYDRRQKSLDEGNSPGELLETVGRFGQPLSLKALIHEGVQKVLRRLPKLRSIRE